VSHAFSIRHFGKCSQLAGKSACVTSGNDREVWAGWERGKRELNEVKTLRVRALRGLVVLQSFPRRARDLWTNVRYKERKANTKNIFYRE
jgi:hypothetical protein